VRSTYVPFNPRFLGPFRRGDLSRGRLVRHVIMITAGDVGRQLSMTHSAARRVHTRANGELAVRRAPTQSPPPNVAEPLLGPAHPASKPRSARALIHAPPTRPTLVRNSHHVAQATPHHARIGAPCPCDTPRARTPPPQPCIILISASP